jgi:hypothetical protein
MKMKGHEFVSLKALKEKKLKRSDEVGEKIPSSIGVTSESYEASDYRLP